MTDDIAWTEQQQEAIMRAVNRLLAQGYTHDEIRIERPSRDRVIGPFQVPYIVTARRDGDEGPCAC